MLSYIAILMALPGNFHSVMDLGQMKEDRTGASCVGDINLAGNQVRLTLFGLIFPVPGGYRKQFPNKRFRGTQ